MIISGILIHKALLLIFFYYMDLKIRSVSRTAQHSVIRDIYQCFSSPRVSLCFTHPCDEMWPMCGFSGANTGKTPWEPASLEANYGGLWSKFIEMGCLDRGKLPGAARLCLTRLLQLVYWVVWRDKSNLEMLYLGNLKPAGCCLWDIPQRTNCSKQNAIKQIPITLFTLIQHLK